MTSILADAPSSKRKSGGIHHPSKHSYRRKLIKGNVLQAERQRMIVAEANRIAVLNAASPRYGQCNRQAPQLFEQLACNVNFLWEGVREGYLFLKKRYPSLTPSQRKFSLQASSSKRCDACRLHFPARGEAALALLYDLAYFYHPLPLCSSCFGAA